MWQKAPARGLFVLFFLIQFNILQRSFKFVIFFDMNNVFNDFKKLSMPRKVSISLLLIMVSMINGKTGAKIVSGLLKEFYHQRKNKKLADSFNNVKIGVMFSRLARDGLVEREKRGLWKITERGRVFIKKYLAREEEGGKIDRSRAPDLMLVFDVPEKRKKWRNWLRGELCFLGFKKVQKSVWLGWSPLPEYLLNELARARLVDCVQIFSVVKRGTLS